MNNKYDVLIVGGGTSGCACAYTCGKLGLRTLLVENQSFLGGSITSSLVIPAMKISPNSINNDFYNSFYNNLSVINGAKTYVDGNSGWFNPELAKIVLDKMMKDVNVDILFNSTVKKIDKNLLTYIVSIDTNNNIYNNKELLVYIETKYLVDATGDAKICKKINSEKIKKIEFFESEYQPVNLRFIMSGINAEKFADWLMQFDDNRDVSTSCVVDGQTLFSTAYTWDDNVNWALKPLFMRAIKDNIITVEDSNYFQIFSVAGTKDSAAFNCPRILDKDISETEAYIKGRESIFRISEFCKNYLPGFENAYISSIANTLGIRVSTRVKGKYVYTKEDLISGKKFDNPVLISNYPIDVHSSDKNKSKLEKVYLEYQLPVESLIIDDNLFVTGRCISADFDAQAALRIIPSCFSMGEGLSKYIYSCHYNNSN